MQRYEKSPIFVGLFNIILKIKIAYLRKASITRCASASLAKLKGL